MDFDDMAFAHMLKDYTVFSFPGLVTQFRAVVFFGCCCFFLDAVVYRVICIKSVIE